MRLRLSLLALSLVAFTCGPASPDDHGIDPDGDDDGDGISNRDEGAPHVDTDGDGIPDYLDLDSDNDGIPDYREAGDQDLRTPPVDSDGDGIPDFRDTDSDNNGRPDGLDGLDDTDGDGIPDFQDRDDDGDGIPDVVELGPDPLNPLDSDGDGIPDFRDTDSDNDTILDRYEGAGDYDGDGIPNYLDLDSDGDCIPDELEAGGSPPIDSDGDGRPDFLDRDSDNDGLADGEEDVNCNGIQDPGETSATNPDSDGDGVSDLVETVAGTDPNDPDDNPQARGDFFFLVPYQQPTTPSEDTLRFRTSVQYADLYFNFDITGSMSAEMSAMANVNTGVPAIINELRCPLVGGACALDEDCATGAVCFDNQCIRDPVVAPGCVPNLWSGVGHWNNFNTYRNRLSVQGNPSTTANSITTSLTGGTEAPFQAAQCVADGAGCTSPVKSCAAGGVGCPGFRPSAVRILIQISDADDQCSATGCNLYTAATAGAALAAAGIKFIGLWGTGDDSSGNPETPESTMRSIGIASGTVNTSNQPFVYPALDAQVVPQTKQAVLDIVRGLPLAVTIDKADQPGDDGDALQFIDHLRVNVSGGPCTTVTPTADTDGDGRPDAFPALLPGTRVCWDVVPIAQNGIVPARPDPQLFIARLTVYGDGSPLDSRDVYFLVPPANLDPPID
jgi:hypothetical protein